MSNARELLVEMVDEIVEGAYSLPSDVIDDYHDRLREAFKNEPIPVLSPEKIVAMGDGTASGVVE